MGVLNGNITIEVEYGKKVYFVRPIGLVIRGVFIGLVLQESHRRTTVPTETDTCLPDTLEELFDQAEPLKPEDMIDLE